MIQLYHIRGITIVDQSNGNIWTFILILFDGDFNTNSSSKVIIVFNRLFLILNYPISLRSLSYNNDLYFLQANWNVFLTIGHYITITLLIDIQRLSNLKISVFFPVTFLVLSSSIEYSQYNNNGIFLIIKLCGKS